MFAYEKLLLMRLVLRCLLVFLLGMFAYQGTYAITVSFPTTGNCAICEIRIEQAVSKINGVQSVSWDMGTDVTTVEYDESLTDCFIVMTEIANVGHDTEWFRAPDSAYALLIGSCCEYERVINYDSVQVGYLSLMGYWFYPLGIENQGNTSFKITPTVSQGLFTIQFENPADNGTLKVSIYSLSGRKVKDIIANQNNFVKFDLFDCPNGCYLAILNENNRFRSTVRLIKAD
jgi:hypothetical protein